MKNNYEAGFCVQCLWTMAIKHHYCHNNDTHIITFAQMLIMQFVINMNVTLCMC